MNKRLTITELYEKLRARCRIHETKCYDKKDKSETNLLDKSKLSCSDKS